MASSTSLRTSGERSEFEENINKSYPDFLFIAVAITSENIDPGGRLSSSVKHVIPFSFRKDATS